MCCSFYFKVAFHNCPSREAKKEFKSFEAFQKPQHRIFFAYAKGVTHGHRQTAPLPLKNDSSLKQMLFGNATDSFVLVVLYNYMNYSCLISQTCVNPVMLKQAVIFFVAVIPRKAQGVDAKIANNAFVLPPRMDDQEQLSSHKTQGCQRVVKKQLSLHTFGLSRPPLRNIKT